jgi:hypothetical protein
MQQGQAFKCPICGAANMPHDHLCVQCGADFSDPDVLAMAPGDSTTMPSSSLGAAGELSASKFLGVELDDLLSGKSLRTLGLVGAILLVVCSLIPVTDNYRDWKMLWSAVSDGPWFALLLPIVAAGIGAAVFFANQIPTWIRGAMLGGVGLFGVFFSLSGLGQYGAAPERVLPIFVVGLLMAGVGIIIRIYRPTDINGRWAMIAGAPLAFLGLVIPLVASDKALPGEFRLFFNDLAITDISPLSAYNKAFDHDAMVQLLGMWGLLPILLLPIAAAVAWKQPGGVWDKSSPALRPIGWCIVLYIPLTYAVYVFNVFGWTGASKYIMYEGVYAEFASFNKAVLITRTKLMVMAVVYALWIQFGAFVIYDHFMKRGEAPAAPPESQ